MFFFHVNVGEPEPVVWMVRDVCVCVCKPFMGGPLHVKKLLYKYWRQFKVTKRSSTIEHNVC